MQASPFWLSLLGGCNPIGPSGGVGGKSVTSLAGGSPVHSSVKWSRHGWVANDVRVSISPVPPLVLQEYRFSTLQDVFGCDAVFESSSSDEEAEDWARWKLGKLRERRKKRRDARVKGGGEKREGRGGAGFPSRASKQPESRPESCGASENGAVRVVACSAMRCLVFVFTPESAYVPILDCVPYIRL